ncbi:hypothetical protein [Jatrophihabitans endophyticus]|uniref:hypothetical protein n=1 Tax=Jatrophihabitans endophyticus TaxID=1206085 RepID=UPI0019E49905|nr:hypothetical protein [Jatrophihabitans endophyticus]MBE7189123.1 hypothetical protein [Jatrophihabitans endophyticus]
MTAALAVALPALAKGGEAVKAGPVGLGVILLLCIACYFLFKSMSKHMRKVRDTFPADGVEQRPGQRSDQRRPEQTTPSQDPPTAE